MFSNLRQRCTYANVVSSLCLFVVMAGGTAHAADTIGSADIIDESIISADIKNGEVKNTDLATSAVTSAKINNGSVINSELGLNAVTSNKVLDDTLTGADVAPDTLTGADVALDTITGADIVESTLSQVPDANTVDGKDSTELGGVNGSGATSALGGNPTATFGFIGPVLTRTIAAGNVVHVTASKALGSTAVGGASDLHLYPCYKPTTGSLTPVGGGMLDLRVAQNTRHTFGVSRVFTLPAGAYDFGMCGLSSDFANWNSNDWGYVSLLILRPNGTALAAAASAPDDGPKRAPVG